MISKETISGMDYKELRDSAVNILHPLLRVMWPYLEVHEGYQTCVNCGKSVFARWKNWSGREWYIEVRHDW